MSNSQLADAFRRWGHLQAGLDPLGRLAPWPHRDLDNATGKEAEALRSLYCGTIGAEFMHLPFPERVDWITERFEGKRSTILDTQRIFQQLAGAELFEDFLHRRYVGSKRFSLEGTAAIVPVLHEILEKAATLGVETVLIGMSHRGRLTVMHLVIGSPASYIFSDFEDLDPKSSIGSGDVKYHRGATGLYKSQAGADLDVRLASNPSHLEIVNPIIMGRALAKQIRRGDLSGDKVLTILFHGDAAFAGQGVVPEALNASLIPGYNVGGTIHIVVNNLIGFTAEDKWLHSSRYATDVAKRLDVPIFHVNAEHAEDAVWLGNLAMEYQHTFKTDVVMDVIGYRRYGHNEVDDPTVTSPVTYQKISKLKRPYENFAARLKIPEAEIKRTEEKFLAHFDAELEVGRQATKKPTYAGIPKYWDAYTGGPYHPAMEVDTGVPASKLAEIGRILGTAPQGFNVHPKLQKLLEQRLEMAEGKRPLDWGMAELMAFGSLLESGTPVRLVGQDSRRGTFNHRHAVLLDYQNGKEYVPLTKVGAAQARFDVYSTILSEEAIMAFEYGYSRDYPETLVLWEAQFGDFVNGAQMVIDQFLAAGEDKWGLLSGLVLLLPHAYEGQGPEHTSARLERFLQLCAEDNMQVCYPSNAAQYFHLLRRQALRSWRKPLIVMSPKGYLRAAPAASPLEALTHGRFAPVLDDVTPISAPEKLIFCTGKIAHELRAERDKQSKNTAVVTIEQLYPFPEEQVQQILNRYRSAARVVWVQEEPSNAGALFFVRTFLERLAAGRQVSAIHRAASASPATGSAKAHAMEQESLIKVALS